MKTEMRSEESIMMGFVCMSLDTGALLLRTLIGKYLESLRISFSVINSRMNFIKKEGPIFFLLLFQVNCKASNAVTD